MSDTPRPLEADISSANDALVHEVSARAEALQRVQALATRLEAARRKYAEVREEVADILAATRAELGGGAVVFQ